MELPAPEAPASRSSSHYQAPGLLGSPCVELPYHWSLASTSHRVHQSMTHSFQVTQHAPAFTSMCSGLVPIDDQGTHMLCKLAHQNEQNHAYALRRIFVHCSCMHRRTWSEPGTKTSGDTWPRQLDPASPHPKPSHFLEVKVRFL